MSNLTINDNTFLRQFEVEIDNDLAKIEYALQDRKIFLTKLVVCLLYTSDAADE